MMCMDKKGNTDIPSKGKIIMAWILLIILSACLAGLIYEKKNYNLETKETNTEQQEDKIPDIVITMLKTIVDNYNSNPTTLEYRAKSITTEAKLQDKYIIISYMDSTTNTEIKYEYDLMKHTLSSKLENTNKGVFENIFKILVMACQTRLENEIDISGRLDKFLAGEEIKGLSINDNIYEIDVIEKIEDTTTNMTETTDTNTQ